MSGQFALTPRAQTDLDEIWDYTVDRWGFDQAETYTRQRIARSVLSSDDRRDRCHSHPARAHGLRTSRSVTASDLPSASLVNRRSAKYGAARLWVNAADFSDALIAECAVAAPAATSAFGLSEEIAIADEVALASPGTTDWGHQFGASLKLEQVSWDCRRTRHQTVR